MQRVAQDWLVLRILTNDSASAVGVTTALQFGPSLLLGPHAGLIADRVDTRKLLIATQTAMGLIAACLTVDVLAGHAQLWHVYLAALLSGAVAAYDSPARQIFVARMVPPSNLPNAVGLNAASFNVARLVGPAAAGVVIAAYGPGWVFGVNALTFAFPATAMALMRTDRFYDVPRVKRAKGQVREGLAYVRHRSDIRVIIIIISLVSMVTLNYQVTMVAMVRSVFHLEAGAYGMISSVFAVGSLTGALVAARRKTPRVRTVIIAAFGLGVASLLMAVMPSYWTFAIATVPVGFIVLTLLTSANQTVQMSTDPDMRGRVMSLYMMCLLGVTPIGAPGIGWVCDTWGPRWGLLLGALTAIGVSAWAAIWARRHWNVHFAYSSSRPFITSYGPRERAQFTQLEIDHAEGSNADS